MQGWAPRRVETMTQPAPWQSWSEWPDTCTPGHVDFLRPQLITPGRPEDPPLSLLYNTTEPVGTLEGVTEPPPPPPDLARCITQSMCEVDKTCLAQCKDGLWHPFRMSAMLHQSVFGVGDPPLWVRRGIMDEQVVAKRMMVGAEHFSWPASLATEPGLLLPLARVKTDFEISGSLVVYPYRMHGTVGEWICEKHASNTPLTDSECAHAVHEVLVAATALMSCGITPPIALTDEAFVDGAGGLQLRVRHDMQPMLSGPRLMAMASAKWLTPEEVGSMATAPSSQTWQTLCFRLGLLLYCLGSLKADPYELKNVEMVLDDLKREVQLVGTPVRPDMSAFQLSADAANLVQECLCTTADDRPTADELTQRLNTLMSRTPHIVL